MRKQTPAHIKNVIVRDCYVSSSTDHVFNIHLIDMKGAIYNWHWFFEGYALINEAGLHIPPQYLKRLIKQAIKANLLNKSQVFCELNQDKTKRYFDLRYHHDGWIAHALNTIKD